MEDNELRAYFAKIDKEFSQVNTRFDHLKTEVREAHVEIELLRGDVQQNNELIHLVDKKLERFRVETRKNFKGVHKTLGVANAALIHRVAKLEKKAS